MKKKILQDKSYTCNNHESIIYVPNIGNLKNAEIVEILVNVGDIIKIEQIIIILESEKTTIEIPSSKSGKVKKILINLNDQVSEGDPILILDLQHDKDITIKKVKNCIGFYNILKNKHKFFSTSPIVRKIARKLNINLSNISGTGRKNRITKKDIEHYIKINKLSENTSLDIQNQKKEHIQNTIQKNNKYIKTIVDKTDNHNINTGIDEKIEYSNFGKIEIKQLEKIKYITGTRVYNSWVSIPQVTQFFQADITDLEQFRKSEIENNKEYKKYKLTILSFIIKILCIALIKYPQFNSSLDKELKNLIYKYYYNIGIAVNTNFGLVVPVIKQVDKLSILEISIKIFELSNKAKEKKLSLQDVSGGCFTVSNLGKLGGEYFTPIVNKPEVGILGISNMALKPVYKNGTFVPRLILPLSLSYDHRVIDGMEAAQFTYFISECLNDIRKIIL